MIQFPHVLPSFFLLCFPARCVFSFILLHHTLFPYLPHSVACILLNLNFPEFFLVYNIFVLISTLPYGFPDFPAPARFSNSFPAIAFFFLSSPLCFFFVSCFHPTLPAFFSFCLLFFPLAFPPLAVCAGMSRRQTEDGRSHKASSVRRFYTCSCP